MHSGNLKIFHVWHTVSSVAQKRNPVDFSNSICKIARLRVIRIFKNFKIGLEVFPNLIHVHILITLLIASQVSDRCPLGYLINMLLEQNIRPQILFTR